MIEIAGKLDKIFFKNEDFIIGLLCSKEGPIKIIGNIFGVDKGEELVVKGVWETHPKFGKQLKVEFWERSLPKTEEQVITFLSSPMIKGCGKKVARSILKELGENALQIITKQGSSCLSSIRGIGKKRAYMIAASVKSTFELQDIMSRLLKFGVSANMVIKAYKIYGSETVEILTKNPYILIELNLVSFQKADEIGRAMGILPTSNYRMKACLHYVLKRICFEAGHTYVSKQRLMQKTLLALNHNTAETDIVTADDLENSIMQAEENYIVNEEDNIFPSYLYYHEVELARKLSKMLKWKDCWGGEALPFLEKAIEKYQKEKQIVLAKKQREAIRQLFEKQITILNGGPGTGKTTVIRAITDIYQAMYPNHNIKLAAPTGRASRNLAKVTEHEASTIHRLIKLYGDKPLYNYENHLSCNLLIVDEFSMVDIALANYLFQAVPNDTKILVVGDVDQLPSVSPGNVLNELIASGITTVTLTEVFRQAMESQIVNNAHRINKGKSLLIDQEKDDFFFLIQEYPENIAKLIIKCTMRFIEKGYSLSEILVLSPMKKGQAGTIALNEMLRTILNPVDPNKQEWKVGKKLYREGDKVIQTRTDYEKEVYNGDLGMIEVMTKEKNEYGDFIDILKVNFGGQLVTYKKEELKVLDLAYAITIHKSQGGEAPVVIIPVTTNHHVMLARNLIYTGMTRAKERLVFIGTQKAMDIAIQNNKVINKNSKLATRIMNFKEKGGNQYATTN
ncbi:MULTISPECIES: SF1B family DNA helicase RecD2 [Oceanobacillus]|uniref:SF1B family DNA helicase RecD2 n=1 Tax=Oceanobacillus TaxID=182709 RepID=UPI0005961AA2|nr:MULTISPECIES: ATP-dependent RecD-like DNA helicase [Oceanobacillus]